MKPAGAQIELMVERLKPEIDLHFEFFAREEELNLIGLYFTQVTSQLSKGRVRSILITIHTLFILLIDYPVYSKVY